VGQIIQPCKVVRGQAQALLGMQPWHAENLLRGFVHVQNLSPADFELRWIMNCVVQCKADVAGWITVQFGKSSSASVQTNKQEACPEAFCSSGLRCSRAQPHLLAAMQALSSCGWMHHCLGWKNTLCYCTAIHQAGNLPRSCVYVRLMPQQSFNASACRNASYQQSSTWKIKLSCAVQNPSNKKLAASRVSSVNTENCNRKLLWSILAPEQAPAQLLLLQQITQPCRLSYG